MKALEKEKKWEGMLCQFSECDRGHECLEKRREFEISEFNRGSNRDLWHRR